MTKYPFRKIEAKWQAYWERHGTFKANEDYDFPPEKRAYVLDMFPYPSGAGLHVGHPEGYTATDIYSRYLRMNGYNVLHPMGFDSFGLPAETYAIETGTHPRKNTETNIKNFRRQMKRLGFSYDWDREISTHEPAYYKWTQWIFLRLWERGLAYIAEVPVWYCEKLGTVLANEEVIATPEGPRSERGMHPVERKPLRQWMLKITDYANRLLEDLDTLDWPESLKTMQRNWIGKSVGANIHFDIEDNSKGLEIYTTRPDTLFGVSYMVLAPEHIRVQEITIPAQRDVVEEYVKKAALKSDLERTDLAKEKTGVFTGAYAVNPINNNKIPIWISDYILVNYGTGAIMAVPGHDERDWEFASYFGLPIIQVILPENDTRINDRTHLHQINSEMSEPFTGKGVCVNSGHITGLPTDEAKKAIITWLEKEGKGMQKVNYRLRDWIFSRQRYWGEPIPIVQDAMGNHICIPESELPLTLPDVQSYNPAGTGESPLANLREWVETSIPGQPDTPGRRETSTMPQWAGSCWYYLRYIDPKNDKELADRKKIEYWMPVDLYVGGTEHAVLHLLYARFWHKLLYDIGIVNTTEPFQRLVNQGMITSFAYRRPDSTLVSIDEVEEFSPGKFREKESGLELSRVTTKMSKSLKNVINPDDIIDNFGADSMRIYEMFMGPLEQSKPWSTKGLIGIHRFLDKVWRTAHKPMNNWQVDVNCLKLLHQTIRKVGEDTSSLNFNTAISQMMIFINEIYKQEGIQIELWKTFLKLLGPYAPHLAEELWEMMGENTSIALQPWPEYDTDLIADKVITLVIQVNGKLRAKIQIAVNAPENEIKQLALNNKRVQEYIGDNPPHKIIVVPNKLVNIVTG